MQHLAVLDQMRLAFRPGNRLASCVALPLGGLVPLATYCASHDGPLSYTSPSSYLAAAGLIYSGLTVYDWMREILAAAGGTAQEAQRKALAFVVLTEGTLALSPRPWLALCVLGLLVAVNAIALSTALTVDRQAQRAAVASSKLKPRAKRASRVGPLGLSSRKAT